MRPLHLHLPLIAALACGAAFAAPQVTTTPVSGSDEVLDFAFDYTLVEVTGLPAKVRARVRTALNGFAKSTVDGMKADLMARLEAEGEASLAALEAGLPAPEPGPALPESSCGVEIAPLLLSDEVLAFQLTTSTYYAGAAYPNTHVSAMIFDARTGEEVALGALLDQEGPATLLEAGAEALAQAFPDGELTAPTELSVVIPTRTGFRLVWNTYELGPRTLGTPTVEVPYAALNELLLFDPASGATEPQAPSAGIEDAITRD